MTPAGTAPRVALGLLLAVLLVAGLAAATRQTPTPRPVPVPDTATWTVRPEPPRPTEPYPGAWCGNLCRNGHLR